MSYDNIFTMALKYFDEGNFPEAERLARQIHHTAPNNPDVLNLLGLIAQAKGLHNEACSYFSAAIRQKNDNAGYLFNLAFSLKALGQYVDALINFNKVLELAPTVKETHNEIACIYETIGDIDKARLHWQYAIQMSPDYLTAQTNLANSYRTDDINRATDMLENIIKEHPDDVLALYDMGWLKYNQSDYQSALSYVGRALKEPSPADSIYYLQGLCFLAQNKTSDAQKSFTEAVNINSHNYDAMLCLADILSRSGQYQQAENFYKILLEANISNYLIPTNYGEMLYRQNRLLEALEQYHKAVILNPKSPDISNNLGSILKDMGDYDKALELFFNALALAEDHQAASINIWETLVLIDATDKEKALQIAKNWQKSYPNSPFAKQAVSIFEGENIENNQIFTEQLFDGFADSYEMVMQNLDYSAPMAVRRVAGPLEGRIVDLGCGSGLVGMVIKSPENYIIGVDLSAQMLSKAASKKVYSELVKSDIFDFLSYRSDFKTIIAADVFGYIPDIEKLLFLCKGKNIIFTIETLKGDKTKQIQSNGRLQHNPDHIKKILLQNRFCDIYMEDIVLRYENETPVHGCIFKATGT